MIYAKVALGLPIDELFDYLIPENFISECACGSRVLVPFSRRSLVGYVAGLSSKTDIPAVKPIIKLLDSKPILNAEFLKLTKAVSDYYCSSWGQTIEAALPVGVRKGFPVNIREVRGRLSPAIGDVKQNEVSVEGGLASLTDNFSRHKRDPASAGKVDFIQGESFEARFKLYSAQIDRVIAQRKSVILLSPEIKSCLKIYNLLKEKYSDRLKVTYRKQKVKEELRLWEQAKNGDIDILVGTRPAVFAPFANLGLLIVDEEEAYGFKEEQSPYYHARDVAIMRARLEGIPLLLSGRVPSLESYYAIKRNKYELLSAGDKNTQYPKITIADMSQHSFSRHKVRVMISAVLEDKINKALAADKKVIIFINRKGFSRYAYCQKCGFILTCDECSSKFIFYSEEKKLICNSCGQKKALVSVCPKCNARYIRYAGFGIEKIINQLNLLFPQARISRMDKEHQGLADDFQILVATEIIFHQERLPKADMTAVVDLDSALNIINFRSSEKMYSLLYRLRGLARDDLILQTRAAERYLHKEFLSLDINKLYDAELKERNALRLPPFMHLAQLNLRGRNPEQSKLAAFKLYEKLNGADKKLSVFEPIESIPFKLRGKFRFKILLKAKNPAAFKTFLSKHLKKVKHSGVTVTVDVDPQ